MSLERFENRSAAGRSLADVLAQRDDLVEPVVLALPRGGVPVAYEVAARLGARLEVFIVRKLGVPGHEELAMGAVASGGLRVFNQSVLNQIDLPPQTLARIIAHAEDEVKRREHAYCGDDPHVDVSGRTVIIVDDGLATGSTMLAAVRTLRQQHPARIIAAVPVSPTSTRESVAREVDAMICLLEPEPFYGVGLWYADFEQTTDDEVREILDRARRGETPAHVAGLAAEAREQRSATLRL